MSLLLLHLILPIVSGSGLFHFAVESSEVLPGESETDGLLLSTCQLYGSRGLSASFSRYTAVNSSSLFPGWRLTSLTCAYRTFPATTRSREAELVESGVHRDASCVDLLTYSTSSLRAVAFRKYLSLCSPFYQISRSTNSFFNTATSEAVALDATPQSLVVVSTLHSFFPAFPISIAQADQPHTTYSLVLHNLACAGRTFNPPELIEILLPRHFVPPENFSATIDSQLLCATLDDLHQVAYSVKFMAGDLPVREQCVLQDGQDGELGASLVLERERRAGGRWKIKELTCNSVSPRHSQNNRFAALEEEHSMILREKLHRIENKFNNNFQTSRAADVFRGLGVSEEDVALAQGVTRKIFGLDSRCHLLRMSEYSGISFNRLCGDQPL